MKYLEAYSRFIKDNNDLENDIRYTVKIDPNIFGDLNIDNVDSFEIIFNLK